MQYIGLALNLLKYSVIASVAIYFLVAIGLTMLTARLRARGTWMAWIPFINIFLLCRLAQSSFAWFIPVVIPGVGFFALGYLGARIAKRLGTSAVVGAMFGIPLLGAVVPIPLAVIGKTPDAEGESKPASLGLGVVAAVLGVMLLLGGGFVGMGYLTANKAPTVQQAMAALPKHTSGTLTEFPIDTDKTRPAKPSNVTTQHFGSREQAKSVTVRIPAKQLPPWIEPAELPVAAESMASAEYRVAPNDPPITVVTLMLRDGETQALAPPSKEEIAKAGPGAKVSGIEVKTPQGEVYRGYSVKTEDSAYYAVKKNDGSTGVVISANNGADLQVAERLAMNVGNGKGLLEYEEYAGAFGELPEAPKGMELEEVKTFTQADIDGMVKEFDKVLAEETQSQDPAIKELIDQAKLILPTRVTMASYTGGGTSHPVLAGVAAYENSRSAWIAYQTMGFLSSNATSIIKRISSEDVNGIPRVEPITIGNASGYTASIEEARVILLRRGGSIVGMIGDEKAVNLKAWAEAYVAASGK